MTTLTIVLLLAWSATAHAATKCEAPKYRTGPPVVDTFSMLYMAISTDLSNFTPKKLVCLAAVLRQQYPRHASIFIPIFSSQSAARAYKGVPAIDDESPDSKLFAFRVYAESHYLHGLYSYDQSKQEEYVLLKPIAGLGQVQTDTRIDLPPSSAPRCAQEVAGRCLLEAERIAYPSIPSEGDSPRTVILTGTIDRKGAVADIRALTPSDKTRVVETEFVKPSIAHLASWRFEAASTKDSFQTTVRFEVAPAVPRGRTDIEFALPAKVVVRAGTGKSVR